MAAGWRVTNTVLSHVCRVRDVALTAPVRTLGLESETRHKKMNILTLRLEKGWSQEELAAHSGLSVRTIQRIENGQRASLGIPEVPCCRL